MSASVTDIQGASPIPLPPIQADARRYWDAARDGTLLLKQCEDCSQRHFYPRDICPFCSSRNTVWIGSSGWGEIYSFTVIRRGLPSPQALAYVALEDGPTLMGELLVDDIDTIGIGQRVKAGFVRRFDDRPFLIFMPSDAAASNEEGKGRE